MKKRVNVNNYNFYFVIAVIILLFGAIFLFIVLYKFPMPGEGEGVLSNLGIFDEISCDNYDFISPENIIPYPQNYSYISCNEVIVNSSWKIYSEISNLDDNFSSNYLRDGIMNKTGNLINLEVLDISDVSDSNRIVIGNPNTNDKIREIAFDNGIEFDSEITKGFNQGYIILIKPNEILILGNSSKGSFYGMVSLKWLLKNNGGNIILPNTYIRDWPDLEVRGFYGGGIFDLGNGDIINTGLEGERWIEMLTMWKYNLFLSGISYLNPNPSESSIARMLERERFLKNRHIYTSVTLGPGGVTRFDKNLYEGIYAQNISAKFNDLDVAIIDKHYLIINNSDFEDDVNNDNIPDDWHISESNAGFYDNITNWTIDCTESRPGSLGSCSAKLSLSKELLGTSSSAFLKSGNDSSNMYYDVEPNKIYEISVWVKINDLTYPRLTQEQLTFVLYNSSGNQIYTESLFFNDIEEGVWVNPKNSFSTYNGESKIYIYSRTQGSNALEMWIDDLDVKELTTSAVNIIETNDTKIRVHNEDKTIEYVRDIDYTIEFIGELNATNPTDGRTVIINRVLSGSIPFEGDILLDYDFLPKMQQWRKEDKTFFDSLFYETYREKVLRPTLDNIKPDYVFVALDEIRGANRDSRSIKKDYENYEAFGYHFNDVVSMVHEYSPDSKVLIWDDMIIPFANGGNINYQLVHGGKSGKSWYGLDLIKRENVNMISWHYSILSMNNFVQNVPNLYNKYGFEMLVGPWNNTKNIKWWSNICYENNCPGMVDHEFFDSWDGAPIAANYSWNAVKENIGINSENIEICDGVDNDGDNIQEIYNWRNDTWPSNIDEGFNLTSDPFNCGSCENVCYYPRGFSQCVDGTCVFDSCFNEYYNANSDLSDGCECKKTSGGIEICDGIDNDCNGVIDDTGSSCDGNDPGDESPDESLGDIDGCSVNWSCSWGQCVNGIEKRECIDLNNCSILVRVIENRTCIENNDDSTIINMTNLSEDLSDDVESPIKFRIDWLNYLFYFIIIVMSLFVVLMIIIAIRKKIDNDIHKKDIFVNLRNGNYHKIHGSSSNKMLVKKSLMEKKKNNKNIIKEIRPVESKKFIKKDTIIDLRKNKDVGKTDVSKNMNKVSGSYLGNINRKDFKKSFKNNRIKEIKKDILDKESGRDVKKVSGKKSEKIFKKVIKKDKKKDYKKSDYYSGSGSLELPK
ncbi:hypothetical protein GOV12_06945 [Candidatus Pacearchaeota archaeon]|nr:hypothetical protein [Candidatus Pacearchaeota archaeon]